MRSVVISTTPDIISQALSDQFHDSYERLNHWMDMNHDD
jgi:hypothetical protein